MTMKQAMMRMVKTPTIIAIVQGKCVVSFFSLISLSSTSSNLVSVFSIICLPRNVIFLAEMLECRNKECINKDIK